MKAKEEEMERLMNKYEYQIETYRADCEQAEREAGRLRKTVRELQSKLDRQQRGYEGQ